MAAQKPLFVLYGSATGNSEHIAKDLASKCEADKGDFYDSVICCELDQFKKKCSKVWDVAPSGQSYYPVVVVASTTGNGDPPENAGRFVRFLKRKTTAKTTFQHCAYAVLALGDTNYDQFCNVGKIIDSKMHELGGMRAKTIGLADEATGLEDVVEPFVASVLGDLKRACLGTGDSAVAADSEEAGVDLSSEEKKEEHKMATATNKPHDEGSPALTNGTPTSGKPPQAPELAFGLKTLQAIAVEQKLDPIPTTLENASLPSICTSRSSCELLSKLDADAYLQSRQATLSRAQSSNVSQTTTSTACHYSMYKPYDAAIVGARYLTRTDTTAARSAANVLQSLCSTSAGPKTAPLLERVAQAMDCYSKQFPLPTENYNNPQTDPCRNNDKRVVELTLALPDPSTHDHPLEYEPGDAIGLLVPNTHDAVTTVLTMLKKHHGVDPEYRVKVVHDESSPLGTGVAGDTGGSLDSVYDVLARQLDLCSVVKKRILHTLSMHTTDEKEAHMLRLLSSKTSVGEQLYQLFIERYCIATYEILQFFPSCTPNLEALMGMMPGMTPRYYSICSSPLEHQGQEADAPILKIAFSVVDYVTPPLPGSTVMNGSASDHNLQRRRKRGLASTFLEAVASPHLIASSSEGISAVSTLPIFPKPTAEFRLPVNRSTPLVLVGPGTGVAPFIGFLAHRQMQASLLEKTSRENAAPGVVESVEGTWRGGYELTENDGLDVAGEVGNTPQTAVNGRSNGDAARGDGGGASSMGSIDLFFGCRTPDHDFIYEAEMMEHKKQGVLTNLVTAFSRQQGETKTYVQHKIMEPDTAFHLAEMILERDAAVYVCGDGNSMGKDVQDAFIHVLTRYCGPDDSFGLSGNEEAGKKFLEEMKSKKKFVLDIWS